MINIFPSAQLLRMLWLNLSRRRRKQFFLILVLMFFASLSEMISIGSVLPFLAIMVSPEIVFVHPYAHPLILFLDLNSPEQLLFPITIAFGMTVLIAGVMRLALLWASTRVSFATGEELSSKIYYRTLYQTYHVHLTRNTSEIINALSSKTIHVTQAIMWTLNLCSSMIMLISILFCLLWIDPFVTLSAFGGLGLIYVAIAWVSQNQLLLNGRQVADGSTRLVKVLQEGLGSIRDIIINGTQDIYCEFFKKVDMPLRRAHGNIYFIGSCPRYLIETLGILLIAAIAYALSKNSGNMEKVFPVLGALALGAQRILPILQQAYAGWSGIQGAQASLKDTLDLLEQPLPNFAQLPVGKSLTFRQHIKLKNLCFRYSNEAPWSLYNLDLKIAQGSRIGFIGTTGSGKSTLLDVIMGLHQATKGTLEIDGEIITTKNQRAWQQQIAHVPQSIFLTDGTIAENIAFGEAKDSIDYQRVQLAAQQAQIATDIESWSKQYETLVGERGARLSGGQRQRIGIARALYRQASVLILDEATSALDQETELAFIESIEELGLELTVLIVAHRLTTLKNCTMIVEIDCGRISRCGSYNELFHELEE